VPNTRKSLNLPPFISGSDFFYDYESQIVFFLGGTRLMVIMDLLNLGPIYCKDWSFAIGLGFWFLLW
jgi:hypothetical protein